MDVYATDFAAFLPNEPVANDQMERVLGLINELPSRTRKIILRNNKIKTRHYALDPATGATTHTNAQLTAAAVRGLRPYPDFTVNDVQCLCCGTSSPDQFFPGHAAMVHAELGGPTCEVMSTTGVCVSGMTALKYAFLNVAQGVTANGVATGSEQASTFLRSRFCGTATAAKAKDVEKDPSLAFDADFLRWMLSDGAGAAFLTSTKPKDRLALRIDWIEIQSFANQLETCMYAGAVKNADGTLTGWREFAPAEWATHGAFMVKQDVRLLNREVVKASVDWALPPLIAKHGLKPGQFRWFLPHYSSEYFRECIHDRLAAIGFDIPLARWFTNLTTKGNTGAAAIYIILAELFRSGRLERGDQLLCFIPESGRFCICYVKFTVV